ncbi:unnamed protein product [Eruca vesicaria subsp. sativa]|uniref:RBR-type E3 ubiquitin transferase n=1 Tax=Eruca vesicaria subsp. sativa TaxID=29727 RepID=A0ABC8L0H9_ERUVS|nr:unnamed protein product [Eruca vesicaria subsp. sativa]
MYSIRQRHYSVLTRAEIREKMMKEVVQISQDFSLSLSDATVILVRLRWNSFKASDLLKNDKDKFLSGLGLVGSSNKSSSGDANLVSTPFCSHKFCTECWRHYLRKTLKKKEDERVLLVSCLSQDCVASVGPDTIKKLTKPVKKMYERYLVASFVESNKETIKWCSDGDCGYAIERHAEDPSEDFGVVCLCGSMFCWSCQRESHRPVTCNTASFWSSKLLYKTMRLQMIAERITHCPGCNSRVENQDGIWKCTVCSVSQPSNESTLIRLMTLCDARYEAVYQSNQDLKAIKRKSVPTLTAHCGLGEVDIKALREALILIVQYRRVLRWSVFGYFISHYHISKKLYLDRLQEKATATLVTHKRTLDELVNGVISGGDITVFRQKLSETTGTTRDYFSFFVKTLEDGLCDEDV